MKVVWKGCSFIISFETFNFFQKIYQMGITALLVSSMKVTYCFHNIRMSRSRKRRTSKGMAVHVVL